MHEEATEGAAAKAGPAEDALFMRERLIRGAVTLIESEGCGSLSVRRLAQAAGRSSMCVYTSFGSRSGLLTAVYERACRNLITAAGSGARQSTAASGYQEWARGNPGLYGLLFDQPLEALDVDPALRGRLLDDLLDVLGDADDGGSGVSASGVSASGDGDRAIDVWGRLHGTVSFERIRGGARG